MAKPGHLAIAALLVVAASAGCQFVPPGGADDPGYDNKHRSLAVTDASLVGDDTVRANLTVESGLFCPRDDSVVFQLHSTLYDASGNAIGDGWTTVRVPRNGQVRATIEYEPVDASDRIDLDAVTRATFQQTRNVTFPGPACPEISDPDPSVPTSTDEYVFYAGNSTLVLRPVFEAENGTRESR